MITRNSYLDKIKECMWNGQIKVITGIRRCGKSTLLFDLFYNYLIDSGVKNNNIIKIQLDQLKFYELRNPIALCDYVESVIEGNKSEEFYLFVDEVQFTTKVKYKEDSSIEVTIYDMLNELKSHKNLDVYVTGSNSKGLSRDIATEFRGRATQIKVFPLSFEEFCQTSNNEPGALIDEYMLYGGMPYCATIKNQRAKGQYLSELIEEVYFKDIIDKNRTERPEMLGSILDYLASQIGSLTNSNNIANAISTTRNIKVSSSLVSRYIDNIEDSFLISPAKRFDIKGKRYFSYPLKYYFEDIGLRNARLNFRQIDPGHIMENIIYNELRYRGYKVDIGIVADRSSGLNKQREIDFVVNNINKKTYIQCAWQFGSEEKRESELRSLQLTDDYFKKIVIRNDIHQCLFDEQGFLHMPLIDFLLAKEEIF